MTPYQRDLQFMTECYHWLYSKAGTRVTIAAEDGDIEAMDMLYEMDMYIRTIEHWQLNDRFDRAHMEVNKLRKFMKPIWRNEQED